MHIRPSSFFPPFSVIRLTQIFEIWLTLILFIWKMSIVMAFPGIHVEVLVVYLFCFLLWHQPSYFPQYWVCVNLVTMSCCFQAPWQWCYGFSLLFSDFLWFFLHVFLFSSDRPTQNSVLTTTKQNNKQIFASSRLSLRGGLNEKEKRIRWP